MPELVINLATLAISEAANDERSQVTTLFVCLFVFVFVCFEND